MELLSGYGLVMDGSENFVTRYLTNDAAILSHKRSYGALSFATVVRPALRLPNYGPTYRDLFPVPPAAGDVLSCSVGASCRASARPPAPSCRPRRSSSSPASASRCPDGSPRMTQRRYRELSYPSIPHADPITELTVYDLFCGITPAESSSRADDSAPERTITAIDLSRRLAAHQPMQLVDVREPFESEIARIDGSELISLATIESSLNRIRTDVPVVVYCRHGSSAERVVSVLRSQGLRNIEQLDGGIDASPRPGRPVRCSVLTYSAGGGSASTHHDRTRRRGGLVPGGYLAPVVRSSCSPGSPGTTTKGVASARLTTRPIPARSGCSPSVARRLPPSRY